MELCLVMASGLLVMCFMEKLNFFFNLKLDTWSLKAVVPELSCSKELCVHCS